MKLRISLFLAVFLTSIFVFVPVIHAQDVKLGETINLGASEVVNKDYFASGQTINLDGTVNGDAYLVAGNITIFP